MNPEVKLELEYYLVSPVQRICRYPLLLSVYFFTILLTSFSQHNKINK